jgi:hypothetical protein
LKTKPTGSAFTANFVERLTDQLRALALQVFQQPCRSSSAAWPPEPFPLRLGALHPRVDPFGDACAFELGDRPESFAPLAPLSTYSATQIAR